MAAQQHNHQGKQPSPRRRREFTKKFKRDAVEPVGTWGRPIAQIAQQLGIDDSTPGNRVRQAQADHGERDGPSRHKRARPTELERDNARLRMAA